MYDLRQCSWSEVLDLVTAESKGDLASLDDRDDESPFFIQEDAE